MKLAHFLFLAVFAAGGALAQDGDGHGPPGSPQAKKPAATAPAKTAPTTAKPAAPPDAPAAAKPARPKR